MGVWRRTREIAPILTVGAIGVIASILFSYLTFATENLAFKQEFEARAKNQALILQGGIDDYCDKLYSLRALFGSSNQNVTRSEFMSLSSSLLKGHSANVIQQLSWAVLPENHIRS